MSPFDLQVNGYAGVDFNHDDLTADQLHHACTELARAGVSGFLATIITDEFTIMCRRLRRLAELITADPLASELIYGLHIEGPFLNTTPGYIGAHPAKEVLPATPDAMNRLLDAANGMTRLVTLAPENDTGFLTTRMLSERGITVSAGHCDPSLETLRGAIEAGLTMFTHLGNGCPMTMHRHDNIIQRALSLSEHLWCCFIPDGVHIPFPALKNYLRSANPERCIVVSDAIAGASLGPGTYSIGVWKELVIGEDLIARSPDGSHFIGSTVTWPQIRKNLRDGVGLSEEDIERLSSRNPRRALGIAE